MSNYVLYYRVCKPTAVALAAALECECGESLRGRPDHLLRWGCGAGIGYTPAIVVNKKAAIEKAVNKKLALELMQRSGVRIPEFTDRVPLIARTSSHTQGQGLWFCWLQEQVAEVRREGADHFIKYIPTKQEYRIHVIDGEVAFVQKKYPNPRVTTAFGGVQQFGDNWHTQVLNPREAPTNASIHAVMAVRALGLDVGGVDVVEDMQGHCFVLEVNTGPALPNPETRRPYVEYILSRWGESRSSSSQSRRLATQRSQEIMEEE